MNSVALNKFLPIPAPTQVPDPQVGSSYPLLIGMNDLTNEIAKMNGLAQHTYLKVSTISSSEDKLANMWSGLYARPLGGGTHIGCFNNEAGNTASLQVLTARQHGTVATAGFDIPRATICTYRSNATEDHVLG